MHPVKTGLEGHVIKLRVDNIMMASTLFITHLNCSVDVIVRLIPFG